MTSSGALWTLPLPPPEAMEALRSRFWRFWGPSPPGPSPPPARPFWVSPGVGEGRPRGVLAATLGELREQAGSVLGLPLPLSLVVAEDGTLVEDEEFWGTLPPHTALLALGPGQRWEPPQAPPCWDLGGGPMGAPQAPPELARLSLLETPGDPRGRLRLSAQIRGVRWDLGALGPHRVLRELLRLLAALSRALGQALLGVSGALRPLLEGPQTHPGER